MLTTPSSFTPLIVPQDHPDSLHFLFQGGQLLLRETDMGLPNAADKAGFDIEFGALHPVGLLAGQYCQTTWCARDTPAPAGFAWHPLRSLLFGLVSEELASVAGRAGQIADWARTHQYCGACAQSMVLATGERCFKCPSCHHLAYPRISPAMMVLIRKGDQFLMAMHTMSPSKRFTPLAGFLEAGESVEEAIHREVYEEVGLRVHNLKYFSSQSWPFPHSLMIAFTADYLDGDIRIDENELSEARWFGPDDAWPEKVPHVSVSSVLVDAHRPPGR